MSGDADGTVTAAFASHDIATDPDALVDILVSRRATVHDHRVGKKDRMLREAGHVWRDSRALLSHACHCPRAYWLRGEGGCSRLSQPDLLRHDSRVVGLRLIGPASRSPSRRPFIVVYQQH